MRTLLTAILVALAPLTTLAQTTNTTGTIAPNTTVTQVQAPTAPNGTTTPGGAGTPGGATTTPTAPAGATAAVARDAAILVCAEDFSTGGARLLVLSASASGGVTTPAPGAQCAQGLADFFAAGFSIIDVQPFNQQLQYTLVR